MPASTRTCLSPYFVGRWERGLARTAGPFDVTLPSYLANSDGSVISSINQINRLIREFVADSLRLGRRPLLLSGDCLSSIGCLAGVKSIESDPYLLWFDAHGDFHTEETTTSGHLGGMPLAMLSGRGNQSLLQALSLTHLPDSAICHIGARELDEGERENFLTSRILRAQRLRDVLPELSKKRSVWVHFDTDYFNPIDAPAMRYTAPGGPSAAAIRDEIEILSREIDVIGTSISAWAPHLDVEEKTAKVCWDIISILLRH